MADCAKHRSRREFLKLTGSNVLLGSFVACGANTHAQSLESKSPANAVQVARVRHLGDQFLQNSVGVTGADGATSTVLPSGKSLWVFGDTIEGPFKTIHGLELGGFRSNTAAIVPQQDAAKGIQQFQFLADADGRRPRQLVPFAPHEDPNKHRVWAIHGTCTADHIYLFYHRITLLKGVDVFVNFQLDGMGIAKATVDKLEFERLTAPDGTLEFWKGDVPSFGVFVERAEDCIYIWGSLATGMYLARTRHDAIADLESYEYLVEAPTIRHPATRSRWSREFLPTAPLFDSVPNEMSAAYNRHLKQYVAFHSLHRENKIAMRTAPQITGPWSEPQIVYRPERITDSDLIYAAKEHPELASQDGRVLYVTYVNSATYVPQLIEVTLK
jgi:uncharacterized protein DUF4185